VTGGFDEFRVLFGAWLEETELFPGKNLHIDLILNPHAGAFRNTRRCRALVKDLRRVRAALGPAHPQNREIRVSTWTTDYPGHEKAILAHLHSADPCGPQDQRLVVTAGGDGTSRGALISALELPREVREGLLFFRLPLGTGNDAAETRDWSTALEILSGRGSIPVRVQPLRVLEVKAEGHPPHFSFNIASVGLDAFVVHMTNRLKSWFPGNSYSLMVDVATFFYELFVRVVPSNLELTDQGRLVLRWEERFLLAALGTSGHRTYGAGKNVLPDDDNFCLAGKRNIFSKLAYRTPFYQGTHRGLEGITLARGDRLRVVSPVRVPVQMDGEVLWLDPSNFPLVMEVVERGLQVLSPQRPL
jgi:diacylglycerol kinase family enzyme